MYRYELWIDVVGGEESNIYDQERIIYEGNDFDDMEAAMQEHDDEVTGDMDKYFTLIYPSDSISFNSVDDYFSWYRHKVD